MANTQGTWVIIDQQIGMQPISNVSTTQNHPFGTIVRAKDVGTTDYGVGEFIYVKGVASGAVGAWCGYEVEAGAAGGATILAVADGNYPVGVMVSALDATTDFGWLQISGHCVGKCLTQFADNGVVYLTATAGSVDDASVIGDVIHNAKGANGGTVTVGDLAGEFDINRPYSENRVSLSN